MKVDSPNTHFWIAEVSETTSPNGRVHEEEGEMKKNVKNKVMGCVGIMPLKDEPSVAQLVRLVVSIENRRMRIGSRLLAQFEQFAICRGYKEARLYTNDLNVSALRFVRQRGYSVVQVIRRGLMRGSLILWQKTLNESEGRDVCAAGKGTGRSATVLD